MRDLQDFTPIEQVCWLAAGDGGRVDLTRPRSDRARAKIEAARRAGAIDAGGWLTAIGVEIAEKADS